MVDVHLTFYCSLLIKVTILQLPTAIAVSRDHKPDQTDERQRIEDAGGFVMWAGKGQSVTSTSIFPHNLHLDFCGSIIGSFCFHFHPSLVERGPFL